MSLEAAVVLGLHGQDGSTQEVATTIPLEVISSDRTDEGAQRLTRWLAETATLSSLESHAIYGPSSAGSDVGQ